MKLMAMLVLAASTNFALHSDDFESVVWMRQGRALCQWVPVPSGSATFSIFTRGESRMWVESRGGWWTGRWFDWRAARTATMHDSTWERNYIEFESDGEALVCFEAEAAWGAQVGVGGFPAAPTPPLRTRSAYVTCLSSNPGECR